MDSLPSLSRKKSSAPKIASSLSEAFLAMVCREYRMRVSILFGHGLALLQPAPVTQRRRMPASVSVAAREPAHYEPGKQLHVGPMLGEVFLSGGDVDIAVTRQ